MNNNIEGKKEEEQEAQLQKQDSDFITERIKKRPINKKKLLRRTVITAAMAVIFATVACLTFLILEPVISNWLYPEEEMPPVEFPAETEEMLPEDMIADESEMEQEQEETPSAPIELEEAQIAQVLDNVQLDVEDYSNMYRMMAEVAREAGKSMVTVTGSVSDVDWFNDTYERTDYTSGIIVAKLSKELLILVNYEHVIDAESIEVTFSNGEQAQAQLRKKDRNTRLAVFAVEAAALKKSTLDYVKAADLSASSGNRTIVGNPVIAIGSPLGTGDSVGYGVITSNSTNLNLTDARYKILTTDIYGSKNASGVLINLNGQVLGFIDNSHNSEDMKNLISAVGITELRRVIERMSNGREQAYLGTHGMDVTLQANENLGVPFGAYITEVEMDSPAMNVGIQSGDIIISIAGKEINTYSDLVNALMELPPDTLTEVVLMRQSSEEYAKMEVEIMLGISE